MNRFLHIALFTFSMNVAACGGDEDAKDARPTDEALCLLKVGKTTQPVAEAILGPPSTTVASLDGARSIWSHMVIEKGVVKVNESVSLYFDAMLVLGDVIVVGRPLPPCLARTADAMTSE